MLHLKRVIYFNEFLRCKVSNELIGYGDYYYEDDEDGLIVKASVYNRLKDKRKRETFDYSELEKLESQREYEQYMKQASKEFYEATILDRKVFNGRG